MATTVIANQCVAGALSGLMVGRFKGSFTPADYAGLVNAAVAVKAQFLTKNTASGAALADEDNANIGEVVYGAAFSAVAQTGAKSTTSADYAEVAEQIYAASKQALASLT